MNKTLYELLSADAGSGRDSHAAAIASFSQNTLLQGYLAGKTSIALIAAEAQHNAAFYLPRMRTSDSDLAELIPYGAALSPRGLLALDNYTAVGACIIGLGLIAPVLGLAALPLIALPRLYQRRARRAVEYARALEMRLRSKSCRTPVRQSATVRYNTGDVPPYGNETTITRAPALDKTEVNLPPVNLIEPPHR